MKSILKTKDGTEPPTFENTEPKDIIDIETLHDYTTAEMFRLYDKDRKDLTATVHRVHEQLASRLALPLELAPSLVWRLQQIPCGYEMESTKEEVLDFEEQLGGSLGTSKAFEKWLADSTKTQAEDMLNYRAYKDHLVGLEAKLSRDRRTVQDTYNARCDVVYKEVIKKHK